MNDARPECVFAQQYKSYSSKRRHFNNMDESNEFTHGRDIILICTNNDIIMMQRFDLSANNTLLLRGWKRSEKVEYKQFNNNRYDACCTVINTYL